MISLERISVTGRRQNKVQTNKILLGSVPFAEPVAQHTDKLQHMLVLFELTMSPIMMNILPRHCGRCYYFGFLGRSVTGSAE